MGKCLGGKCPGGKCTGGICPWGKCPGGTCPEGYVLESDNHIDPSQTGISITTGIKFIDTYT